MQILIASIISVGIAGTVGGFYLAGMANVNRVQDLAVQDPEWCAYSVLLGYSCDDETAYDWLSLKTNTIGTTYFPDTGTYTD